MGGLIYKKGVKALLIVLQTMAVGVLVYSLLNIGFWMEDSFSLSELSRKYEETDIFFRQVDTILDHKIRGQRNEELFETDGELDLQKGIDIQSYGQDGNIVQDMNTTYTLEDLLEFGEKGGQKALHAAIQSALQGQNENRQKAGEVLEEQSGTLETITPVTGITLAECSQWYSDSAGFVLDTYMQLDEVSADIYDRYQEYTTTQDESWSRQAPSNILYCIEDSTSKKLYSNTGASSYQEAVKRIVADEAFMTLFEGERSFNIMVTNPDNVLNQTASEWYMEKRFVSTNEKVYLAVDMTYPVSDILQIYDNYYAQREDIVWGSMFAVVISLGILLLGFILSMVTAGWEEGRCTPQNRAVDRIPTELAASIYMMIVVLVLLFLSKWWKQPEDIFGSERILLSVAASAVYLISLSGCLGMMRRLRTHMLWSNSICRMLLHTWRKVTAARAASGQLLFLYIVFFVLNFLFLLMFERVGIFLVFMLDLVALLILLRDMAGKQSIWDGIHQISKGDLRYKIDTTTLQGETLEMAKAINDMGDGLQKAMETIIRNERLKAELITNVSHDLKTPLTSIVNYVDLLKRENLQGEQVQHYIEVLDQKSQRLKQLTEDLVEASKINSGNIELQMMRMQMQSMIQQAHGEFQERLEERGLTVKWDLEKPAAHIMADGRQLWRILENLLGNIYKYAKENTEIQIRVWREGDVVALSLQNVSREKLTIPAEELMGRFVRGDRSRNTEGSGLGLSIAQSLTELMGGTFELTVEGELFTATIRFPVVEEAEEPGF